SSLLVHSTASSDLFTLSLHDALPISSFGFSYEPRPRTKIAGDSTPRSLMPVASGNLPGSRSENFASCSFSSSKRFFSSPLIFPRSEEHTSELQSPYDLVCRLLLEKKK